MLAALLLVACVARAAPEWVEISQPRRATPPSLHPARENKWYPTQNPVRLPPTSSEDEPRLPNLQEDPTIYSNRSIPEHNWNQNRKVSTKIKRLNTHFKKSNITPEFSLEIYEQVTEMEPVLVTRNVIKDKGSVSATIERVSNKGSVKRVQLTNTPIKSPVVTNVVKSDSPIRRNDIGKYGSVETDGGFGDEFEIKSNRFTNPQKEVFAMTPLSHIKHVSIGTKDTPKTNYDRMITSTDVPTSEPSIPFQTFPYNEYKQKSDTMKGTTKDERDEYQNTPHSAQSDQHILTIKENHISGTGVKETVVDTKPFENIYTNQDKIVEKAPNIVTTKNNVPEENFEEDTSSGDLTNDANNSSPFDFERSVLHNQNTKQINDVNSKGSENKNSDIKVNTMGNVLKFMKVVADTISKNTRRGVSGKVEYLNELKDTLLCSIQNRIDATWPDDTSPTARRRSRAATARGHVEFPSSESSLMTISFLTFAVFLIKLVLQVIHTYKNKAMMVAPLVVATAGRTVRNLRKFN